MASSLFGVGGNGLLNLRVERGIVPVFDICEANTGIMASFFVRLGAVSLSRPDIHMTPHRDAVKDRRRRPHCGAQRP
jgi:hypothetical protein